MKVFLTHFRDETARKWKGFLFFPCFKNAAVHELNCPNVIKRQLLMLFFFMMRLCRKNSHHPVKVSDMNQWTKWTEC